MCSSDLLRTTGTGRSGKAELRNASGIRELSVRTCASLKEATITTTHPKAHFDAAGQMAFTRVETACRLSRYGGDCYGYALLAMGAVDIIVEQGFAHWDLAALIPVVEGAGGILTDWGGKPFYGAPAAKAVNVLACGDKRVHAEALALLRA